MMYPIRIPAMPKILENVRITITSSRCVTIDEATGTPAKCVYASSTSTTEPAGLLASSHEMSSSGVIVPVGLLGVQT